MNLLNSIVFLAMADTVTPKIEFALVPPYNQTSNSMLVIESVADGYSYSGDADRFELTVIGNRLTVRLISECENRNHSAWSGGSSGLGLPICTQFGFPANPNLIYIPLALHINPTLLLGRELTVEVIGDRGEIARRDLVSRSTAGAPTPFLETTLSTTSRHSWLGGVTDLRILPQTLPFEPALVLSQLSQSPLFASSIAFLPVRTDLFRRAANTLPGPQSGDPEQLERELALVLAPGTLIMASKKFGGYRYTAAANSIDLTNQHLMREDGALTLGQNLVGRWSVPGLALPVAIRPAMVRRKLFGAPSLIEYPVGSEEISGSVFCTFEGCEIVLTPRDTHATYRCPPLQPIGPNCMRLAPRLPTFTFPLAGITPDRVYAFVPNADADLALIKRGLYPGQGRWVQKMMRLP